MVRKKAVDDLLAFCKRHYGNGIDSACDRFWDGFNPEHFISGVELEVADINFWEWVTYDDRGLILKDLLLGGGYEVKEKSAMPGGDGHILACRILQTDGNFILSGSGYLYPMHEKDRLVRKIKSSFKKYEKEFPQPALRDFLKNEGHLFNGGFCEESTQAATGQYHAMSPQIHFRQLQSGAHAEIRP
ncbi:MAG: hypothetical protein HY579_09375 [Nitrospinae bacterium]|nr:hypothetical protein [Nitrospinota bacterium]